METFQIAHGQMVATVGGRVRDDLGVFLATTFDHPIEDLDGGAANEYLLWAIARYAASRDLPQVWTFEGQHRIAGAWQQTWLPAGK